MITSLAGGAEDQRLAPSLAKFRFGTIIHHMGVNAAKGVFITVRQRVGSARTQRLSAEFRGEKANNVVCQFYSRFL